MCASFASGDFICPSSSICSRLPTPDSSSPASRAWLTLRAADAAWRPFLQVGLLGSLTTFSAFSVDSLRLFESGATGLALANVALNVGLSLCAVTLGYLGLRALLA